MPARELPPWMQVLDGGRVDAPPGAPPEGGLAHQDGGGHGNGMSDDRITALEKRVEGLSSSVAGLLASVEGLKASFEGLRHAQSILIGAVGIGFALIGGMQLFTLQKVDGVEDTLRQEFRAMRAEAAAQTSAIANSITATKQQTPQVILLPSPAGPQQMPSSEPNKPAPLKQ